MVLKEDIKKLVLEELGIASSVSDFAYGVYSEILDKTDFRKNTEFKIDRTLTDKLKNEHNVSVYVKVCVCGTEDEYKTANEENCASSSFTHNGKFIFINITIPSFRGKIDKAKLSDFLRHEANHILQQINIGHSYADGTLYRLAAGNLYSDNVVVRAVAWIFYLTSKGELESFTNGLYGFITESFERGDVPVKLRESDFFKKMEILEETIQVIEDKKNVAEIEKILLVYKRRYEELESGKKLNVSTGRLIKMANTLLNKFKRNLGRVIAKIGKEIEEDGLRGIPMEKTWFLQFFDFGK